MPLRSARGLSAALLAFLLGADGPPPTATFPPPGMRLDAAWEPGPSDRGVVFAEETPAARDLASWKAAAKFIDAGDAVGLQPFRAAGSVVVLDRATPVLVIARHDFRPKLPPSVMRADEYATAIQLGVLAAADAPPTLLEVRVLGGPYKDRALVLREDRVARLVPDFAAAKPKAPAKKADPAGRAASLLSSAKNLERAGKAAGALDFYRRILEGHPGTPQAAEAAARVKALAPPGRN